MTYLYNVFLRDIIVSVRETLLFLTCLTEKLSVYDWLFVFFISVIPVLLFIVYKEFKKDLLYASSVNLSYLKYCSVAEMSGWFRMDFITWYEIVYIERRRTCTAHCMKRKKKRNRKDRSK